jgi:hypothetical protein
VLVFASNAKAFEGATAWRLRYTRLTRSFDVLPERFKLNLFQSGDSTIPSERCKSRLFASSPSHVKRNTHPGDRSTLPQGEQLHTLVLAIDRLQPLARDSQSDAG